LPAELSQQFLQQVTRRLGLVFAAYARGGDVSPGERLRLEGYMQAGIELGMASREELILLLKQVHLDHLGQELADPFPPMEEASVIPIPVRMQRAPVYPSTSD
jgi:hypothetical protein